MKKIIALALSVAMLILSLLCLSACTETGNNTEDDDSDGGAIGGDMLVGVVVEDSKSNRISIQLANGTDYIVNVSAETKLVGKDGEDITLSDIKKGDHVRVTHNGMVTRSIPPQVSATRIEVLNGSSARSGMPEAETYSMRARVKEIDGGMLVEVISSDYASGDYYFYISDETTVYDSTGAVVAFSYVRVGDVVDVVYGNAVTLSLPPKTNAIRIVVL